MLQAAWLLGLRDVEVAWISGMMARWLPHATDHGGWSTHTPFLASVHRLRCAVSLVTRRPASSLLFGAQKNALRHLWGGALGVVRPQDPAGAGSVRRRYPLPPRGQRLAAWATPLVWR